MPAVPSTTVFPALWMVEYLLRYRYSRGLDPSLCLDLARENRQPKQAPSPLALQGQVLIMARILETPAKSPDCSVSFQVRGQSVCHV